MKASLLFAPVALLLTAGAAWLLGIAFTAPGDHRAILISAAVAFAVQVSAFGIARLLRPGNVMLGWGVGVLARMFVLGSYALIVVKAFHLPPEPALISMVTFFFLSTLAEPLFLAS